MSDGEYTVIARFSIAVHKTLLLLEREDTSIGKSFGLVKLSNPFLRLIYRTRPKLELHFSSLETVPYQQMHKELEPLKGSICLDGEVVSLLNRYSNHQTTNNQVDLQSNHSPQSIRSQQSLSPGRHGWCIDEIDPQASSTTQSFLTQAPPTTGQLPSIDPIQRDLLQLLRNRHPVEVKKRGVSSPDLNLAIDSPLLKASEIKHERELTRTAVTPLSPKTSRRQGLAQPSSPMQLSQATRPEPNESTSTIANPESGLTPSANTLPAAETLPHPALGSGDSSLNKDSIQQKTLPENHSLQFSSNFQRWRRELRQGRYLPQYIARIPEAQLALLESDDAWQPPLVGQRARPGDIPLSLLEELSKVADAPPRPFSPTMPIGSELSHHDNGRVHSKDEVDHESQHSGNSSDSDSILSNIDWPSSPPTQQRRVFLPPDSDPPCISEINRQVAHQRFNDETNPIAETEGIGAHALELNTNDTASLRGSLPNSPKTFSQSKDKSAPSAASTSKSSQPSRHRSVEQGQHSHSVEQDDQSISLGEAPTSSVILGLPQVQNVKTMPVERTPYMGKNISPRQTTSDIALDQSQGTRSGQTLPGSSAFVPGTFIEKSSKENTETNLTSSLPDPERLPPTKMNVAVQSEINEVFGKNDQRSRRTSFHVRDTAATVDASETIISQALLKDHSYPHSPGNAAAPGSQISPTTISPGPLANKGVSLILIPNLVAVDCEPASPANAAQDGNPSRSETPLNSKRALCDSGTPLPNKRRRMCPGEETEQQLKDPAYAAVFDELKAYRREQFEIFKKPVVRPPRSRSLSSSVADHNDDVNMHTPPRMGEGRGNNNAWEESPVQSSTPLTQLSDNDQNVVDRKNTKKHGLMEPTLLPAYATLESLFRKFKDSYSDYRGQLKDFKTAVKVVRKMIKIGNAPHPFLFDDAVFHHFHSYRQFLLDEVLSGKDSMSYDKFYNSRILNPGHLKGIVTPPILESLQVLDDPHNPGVPLQNSRRRKSPTVMEAYNHESVTGNSTKRQAIPPRTSLSETIPASQKNFQDTGAIQSAFRGRSPELGTPGIDRSKPEEPKGRRSLVPSRETLSGTSTPTSAQKRDDRVLKNTASRNLVGCVDQAQPSPNLFIKPSRTSSERRSLASRRTTPKRIPQWPSYVVSETYEWWKDPDTPFKRFEKQHSALPPDKGHGSAGADGGINIFGWRT